MRVAIIGAGAAGLASAKHIASYGLDLDVFEMGALLGGTWVYISDVGTDGYGYPVYSAMYKGLRTSIIPGLLLFLLACSAYARNVIYTDDSTSLEPIMTQSRRTRICTELCTSGLGGTPCGDSCFDLVPTNLPIAGRDSENQNTTSSGNSQKYNATTREGSCDVLCKNKLGYPLCACTYDETTPYATDFMEICSSFCVNYNYQISGCQNCDIYKQFINDNTSKIVMFQTASLNLVADGSTGRVLTIGWGTWCKSRCSNGNGGAACNCDLLP